MESIDLLISEWVQSFRNDILDAFFLFITEFGDETVFLILAAILYWTIDKKFAYRVIMFFLYGAVINGALKFLTNTPRPHIAYPERIVLIGEGSGGTSLPSGHAQNSTILGLTITERKTSNSRRLNQMIFVIVALVFLSRIYLGEHYLSDVIFGFAIAFTFYSLTNRFLAKRVLPKWAQWIPLLAFIPIALLTNDKNVYVAGATILGFMIGYPLEKTYIGFIEKGSWQHSLFKLSIGLGIALALRVGIKASFELGLYSVDFESNPLFTDQLLDFVRYFLITLWMTLGAPFIFKKVLRQKN